MESNPSFSLVFAGSTPSLPSKNSTRQSIFTSRFTLNFDIWRLPLGDFSPPNTYFQYFPPHRLLQSKSSSRNSLFYPTEVNVSRWAGRCPHNPNTVSHSPVKMCSEECRSVSPSPPHPYSPSPTPAGELSMLRSSFQTSTKGKLLLQQAGPVQPAAERRLLTPRTSSTTHHLHLGFRA